MKRGQNAAKEETLAAVGNTLVDDFSGGFPGGPDGQQQSESRLSGVARALPLDAGAAVYNYTLPHKQDMQKNPPCSYPDFRSSPHAAATQLAPFH